MHIGPAALWTTVVFLKDENPTRTAQDNVCCLKYLAYTKKLFEPCRVEIRSYYMQCFKLYIIRQTGGETRSLARKI